MSKQKILLLAACIVAVSAVAGAVIFKNSSNTSQKNQSTNQPNSSNNVNNVDLSPSTPADNQQSNDQKANVDQPSKPVSSTMSANVTYAQVVAGNAQIRALVNGTTTGTCEIVLTQNNATIKKSASVLVREGVTTCDGFTFPASELKSGTWNIATTVRTDTSVSSPTTASIEVP